MTTVAADAAGDDALARRLEEAQLELQRLQDLAADVPELMEQRFRQQLQQVNAVNQALCAERQELLAELRSPLQSPALSEPAAAPMGSPSSRPRWLALGCVAVVVVVVAAIVLNATMRRRLAVEAVPRPHPPAVQPRSAAGTGAEEGFSVIGSDQSLVELESREAVWVEVSDRDGELLLKDTLNGGDSRRIRLRAGLRLFAARPEVVRFRVDEGPWQPWPQQALATGVLELVPRNP